MIEQLAKEPWCFEFFQAVRLLSNQAVSEARDRPVSDDWHPEDAHYIFVGQDKPGLEAIRFRSSPSLGYSSAQISDLKLIKSRPIETTDESPDQSGDSTASNAEQNIAEMTVAFMGLFGGQGSLPTHYTSLIIERIAKKDRSMAEFFDLFNHRLISLCYRAWEKYRPAPALEHARLLGEQDDLLTQALYSLVGISSPSLRSQMGIDDVTLLYYSGLFSHRPRSAVSLQQLLIDFLGVPVTVQQFTGQWLPLDDADWSCCPSSADESENCNNQLGVTMILGDRVWDVQGSFRIRLGPLNYEHYLRFLPTGDLVPKLSNLTRMFVGGEFKFDYVPVLQARCIPRCELGATQGVGTLLGQTAWLTADAGSSGKDLSGTDFDGTDFDGAVFNSLDN